MKRPHPTIALLLWLTAALAAGFVGSQGALRGAMTLYPGLAKPAWSPSPSLLTALFAPLGAVLSALAGFAAWRVSRAEGKGLWLWWLQLALGAAWPWLFFGFGRFGLAFGEAVALWIAILATTIAFSRSDRGAAWALVPSLVGAGLAAILSLAVWRMNP